MGLDERLSALIGRIYCAAHDSEKWDSVAREVLSCVGAHAGLSTLVDLNNREYNALRFYGPETTRIDVALAEYQQIYETDPTLTWAARNPSERFCDSSRTVPSDEYLTHPFIKWNRDRLGSTHWYVGYTPPDDPLSYSFSALFPAEHGPGSAQSLRVFRMLFDHLDCAMRLSRRPFNPDSSRSLFMLDSGGNVRELSSGAQQMLAEADGLTVTTRRLTSLRSNEQSALDAALRRAASTGAPRGAVKISRPSGKRSWILTIKPIHSNYGPFGVVKCELLVEVHDGAPRIGSLDLLQSLCNLTAREMQVVRLLADGHSVETLARCMNISTNTARAHLRTIFLKTETSRQSELIQLCAGLAGS